MVILLLIKVLRGGGGGGLKRLKDGKDGLAAGRKVHESTRNA